MNRSILRRSLKGAMAIVCLAVVPSALGKPVLEAVEWAAPRDYWMGQRPSVRCIPHAWTQFENRPPVGWMHSNQRRVAPATLGEGEDLAIITRGPGVPSKRIVWLESSSFENHELLLQFGYESTGRQPHGLRNSSTVPFALVNAGPVDPDGLSVLVQYVPFRVPEAAEMDEEGRPIGRERLNSPKASNWRVKPDAISMPFQRLKGPVAVGAKSDIGKEELAGRVREAESIVVIDRPIFDGRAYSGRRVNYALGEPITVLKGNGIGQAWAAKVKTLVEARPEAEARWMVFLPRDGDGGKARVEMATPVLATRVRALLPAVDEWGNRHLDQQLSLVAREANFKRGAPIDVEVALRNVGEKWLETLALSAANHRSYSRTQFRVVRPDGSTRTLRKVDPKFGGEYSGEGVRWLASGAVMIESIRLSDWEDGVFDQPGEYRISCSTDVDRIRSLSISRVRWHDA